MSRDTWGIQPAAKRRTDELRATDRAHIGDCHWDVPHGNVERRVTVRIREEGGGFGIEIAPGDD